MQEKYRYTVSVQKHKCNVSQMSWCGSSVIDKKVDKVVLIDKKVDSVIDKKV